MDLEGKTALITGSTDGVGRYVALALGAAGAKVLVHGRDRIRGKHIIEELRDKGNDTCAFYPADLASLEAVRGLAAAVRNDHGRLDLLINNAGVGTGPNPTVRQLSADGHELRFAVNYLAGFLLTRLLLPLITQSAPARIVNVASAGQHPLDFADVMLAHDYSGARAYTQSKLAQILFTFDLARELEGSGVIVTCLHPATFMDTTMVRQSGRTPLSSVEQGGQAILNLAVSPALEGRTGLCFNGLREARADAQAYDENARTHLRQLSNTLTGL